MNVETRVYVEDVGTYVVTFNVEQLRARGEDDLITGVISRVITENEERN